MPGLDWLAAALAVIVLAAAATSVGRVVAGLLTGRRVHDGVDLTHALTHALMGASMAGMFVANLRFLSAAIWQATFAVVIGWYAIRAIAGSRNPSRPRPGLLHQTGHLLSVAAMLYMLQLQCAPSEATGAMNAPNMPMHMALPGAGAAVHPRALSLLIAVLLAGYAVLAASSTRRVVRASAANGSVGLPLAPRAAAASEAAMCAAMAVMLIATR